MSEIGKTFPIECWLTGYVLDPDLQGPIAKARAEFKGHSEEEVRALWNSLESILRHRLEEANITPPTYIPEFEEVHDPDSGETIVRRGRRPVIDWVAMFLHPAQRTTNRRLLQFLKVLHPHTMLSFSKVAALLILHEAAHANPDGAIKAARILDKAHANLRPLVDDAIRVRQARQAGGVALGKLKKERASEIQNMVVDQASRLLNSGRQPHELASLIAPRVQRSAHTVRRILKMSGCLKKRT